MGNNFLLEYIDKDSIIHRLNGATKLICFILWITAIMFTYDIRFLIFLTIFGVYIFFISKINLGFYMT